MSLFLIVSASIVVIVFLLAVIAIRLNSRPVRRHTTSSPHRDPHHPLWMPAMPMMDSHHSSPSHRHDSDQAESPAHQAPVHHYDSSQQDCGSSSSSFDSGFSSGFDSGSSSSFDSGSSGGGSSGCD